MWKGGPTRNWSKESCSQAQDLYAGGGYVGGYICQGCGKPAMGVYCEKPDAKGRRRWVCAECRGAEA